MIGLQERSTERATKKPGEEILRMDFRRMHPAASCIRNAATAHGSKKTRRSVLFRISQPAVVYDSERGEYVGVRRAVGHDVTDSPVANGECI